jgi:tetratricopeptide (TPR) repeat protein
VSEPLPVDLPGAVPASQRWGIAALGLALAFIVAVSVWSFVMSPDRAFVRGNEKYAKGDYRGALEEYEFILRHDPTNGSGHFDRGLARSALHDHRGAAKDFDEAARYEVTPERVSNARLMYGVALANLGDVEGAESSFAEVLPHATSPQLLEISRARNIVGDAEGAIDAADKTLQLSPGDVGALEQRAFADGELERIDDAVADLDRAVAVAPSAWLPRSQRAAMRSWIGDVDTARADAEEAMRLASSPAEAAMMEAVLRDLRGDRDGAFACATRAHELNPAWSYPLSERASIHMGRNELKEALADLDIAASLEANAGMELWLRGFVHALAGERDGALADFARSRDLRPKEYYAPLWLAALGGDASALEAHAKGDGWRARLARFVLARETEADLLAFASSSSLPWEKRVRTATANAFAGILAERANDRERALACYRAAVAENAVGWYVHTWSKARLEAAQKK